jgi:hypothetical protein
MRVYHDWEFLEDGSTIKPISVGMVREDGKELYYEFLSAPASDILRHEWLNANVVPQLSAGWNTAMVTQEANAIVKGNLTIQTKVYDFLYEAYRADPVRGTELWGWYSSYDHVCLAQLFGKMINLPHFIPMWTNDLRQEFYRLGDPLPYSNQVEGVHNALEDAKFIMKQHEWLLEYEKYKPTAIRNSRGIQFGNGNSQSNTF